MKQLAAVVLGATPDDIELAEGFARVQGQPRRRRCRSWRSARSSTRTTPGLPADFDVTLNRRYVYRPYVRVPDMERKYGNLTLTYATQIHACVVEVDPETGVTRSSTTRPSDDCGTRINPQIVEGQVHGATAHAIGAAMHETFAYDEDGNLLTPNFYDYHVPHALDMPPLKTASIESPSPFTPLGTKGMGEGGGGRDPRRLRRDPGRAAAGRRADRLRQLQPLPPRLGDAQRPGGDPRQRGGGVAMRVEGTKELARRARSSGACSTTRSRWRS